MSRPNPVLAFPALVFPALALAILTLPAVGCAPTIHVKVDPITIYAKLDADVRLKLDEDVKSLVQKNPDLF